MTTETRDSSLVATFPPLWLRDNCPCCECRDPSSHQKLFQLLDLPEDVDVLEVVEHDDEIEITFLPDHHRSVFSREWLRPRQLLMSRTVELRTASSSGARATLTSQRSRPRGRSTARTTSSDSACLRGVERLGLALIDGTPATADTVLDIVATFGFVRETNYGKLFDVRIEPDPSNLAFTGLAITPHTDNPYRDPVPTTAALALPRELR